MGNEWNTKVISVRCVYADIGAISFLLGDGMGNTFIKRNLCPAFRWIGGGREFFAFTVFKLLLVQNNTYAKVACFGGVYSDPLHHMGETI